MLDRPRQRRVRGQAISLAGNGGHGFLRTLPFGLDGSEDAAAELLVFHQLDIACGDAEIGLRQHHVQVRQQRAEERPLPVHALQQRQPLVALPGWCGFGSAVEAFLGGAATEDVDGALQRDERLALLQRMHRQWPFFRTLLSNLDMVLAKTDFAIAARYVELVEDKKLGRRIFAAIQTEWQRTQEAVTAITGETGRLASNPSLARSIEHRFPYLDPLNHLQVELMRRYRQAKDGSPGIDRVRTGIHISINGVAAGLRNTG